MIPRIHCNKPDTSTLLEGSINPLFGRTQYLLGAVVFTLKQTLRSEGLLKNKCVVTTSLNGPEKKKNQENLDISINLQLQIRRA